MWKLFVILNQTRVGHRDCEDVLDKSCLVKINLMNGMSQLNIRTSDDDGRWSYKCNRSMRKNDARLLFRLSAGCVLLWYQRASYF